jgi:hypothetical protein
MSVIKTTLFSARAMHIAYSHSPINLHGLVVKLKSLPSSLSHIEQGFPWMTWKLCTGAVNCSMECCSLYAMRG